MTRLLPLLLATVLAAALTGCGQKGDLYLPDPAPEQDKEKPDDKAR